jgi:hypothetical protein
VQLHAAVRELARQTDDLGDGEFGDGARVGEGRVEDGYAELCGRLEVDLVRADAEAADNDEVLCGFEDAGCELGLGADADDVDVPRKVLEYILCGTIAGHVLDLLDERIFAQTRLQRLHLVSLPTQYILPSLVHILQQKNFDILGSERLQRLV